MQTFDFDSFESRIPWHQDKWDPAVLKKQFGRKDVLPASIADMDFRTAPAVQAAIKEAAKNGMYGYTRVGEDVIEAYLAWQRRRNGWEAPSEWFRYTPGVVTAINLLLQTFTEEGDGVLIQEPVYYPFGNSIRTQRRRIISNPLRLRNGHYEIDFADFEKKAANPSCRAFVLCNPHNPVGRVYTREELQRMADICLKHHVFVIADEIHSDLIAPGHRHAVFASLGEAYAENCAVCHSPSKTFNLAGMSFSCIIIPDAARRKAFDAVYDRYCRAHPTFFAPVAAKAAWEQGEEWLEACLAYIRDNEVYVRDFAAKTWGNQVWIAPLEGTYLLWMDFHKLEPDSKELDRRMIQDAGVALDGGTMFGPGGEGFQRLNLAAPRAILQEIMERIAKAFPLPAN